MLDSFRYPQTMEHTSSSPVIQFGVFEVDSRAGELRKNGVKLRIQQQPFQVLMALIESPSQIVSREELRARLWPSDTFVDFEHGLNAAVKRLRDVLGESAERPVFIETVSRRGYRFLGNIEIPAANPPNLSEIKSPPTSAYRAGARKRQFGAAVLAIVVMAAGVAGWFTWHRPLRSFPQVSPTLRRLTANAPENQIIASAISPDGKYLAYSDKTGVYVRLISTGEQHSLVAKVSDVSSLTWFPDGSKLLGSWATEPSARKSLWALSILGGKARQMTDEGWAASVSPDGSQIVFLKSAEFGEMGQEIWLMRANGADPRKLMSFPEGAFALPVWSPDGRWIAYLKFRREVDPHDIWIEVFNLAEGTKKVVLSDPSLEAWGFTWLPDGRLVYAMDEPPPTQHSSNLWVGRLDLNSGRFVGKAKRITSGDGFVVKPSVTADSKRLVFNRARPQSDVYISEFSTQGPRLSTPRRLTFDEGHDLPFDWTPDNKAVLFISDRTGSTNIFRQRIDETSAELLVVDQEKKSPICRLSPDGSQIFYSVPTNPNDNLSPVQLMRAPLNGGPPHLVLEAPAIGNFECSHAPAPAICAFGQEKPKELVISVFDPATGEAHEVATLQKQMGDWGWGLSPDGKSVSASTFGAGNNRIRLLSLSGQPTRELTVKNWSGFTSVDWAADSKGFLVSSNPGGLTTNLLYVDLSGSAHRLWHMNTPWPTWAIPSRNGQYVAIVLPTTDSNVWMTENF